MQVILLLIELFIPEIAQRLSGSDSASLRNRLLRAAIGLLAMALLIFGWELFSHLVLKQLLMNQFNPFSLSIFTAWLLGMIGLSLLLLSRFEQPSQASKVHGESGRDAPTVNVLDSSQISNMQDSPHFHCGVVKTKKIKLKDCLEGEVPDEEWSFFIANQYCRLICNSVSGSRLYVSHLLVAQNKTKMRFGLHKKPDLQAKIISTSGNEYEVKIFYRAWLHIRVRVAINGKYISEKFV